MGVDTSITRFNGSSPIALRSIFSPDYAHAVASKRTTDGALHVGWIDRAGNFTDVTDLKPPSSDFSSTLTDDTPMFGVDGSFYFASRVASNSGRKNKPNVMTTTIENPTQIVVAPNQDDVHGNDVNYWVQPSGRVQGLCAACGPVFENSNDGVWGSRVSDWINDTDYVQVRNDNSMIYRDNVDDKAARASYSYYGTAIIPRTNRDVWSPVASPDGRQIAFLSSGGGIADIFTVSSNGGEPKKVPASDQWITESMHLLGWI